MIPVQRSGSGSQERAHAPDPRQPRQLAVLADQQVAERAPGEVRGRDSLADVAARPGEPAARGRLPPTRTSRAPRRALPTRRARARTSPAGPGTVGELGAQGCDGARRGLALAVGARAEAVGHAPTPDRDPPVGGALQVHVHVGLVGHQLLPGPADLRPRLGRQRLGDDHRAVDRRQRPTLAPERGRVALGRPHHPPRRHRTRGRECAAGRDRGHGRVLVDAHPEGLDHPGQPTQQLQRDAPSRRAA